jgi:transcriptional regulator with XRE-family HTH domain
MERNSQNIIGYNLRKIRVKLGLTQEALCARLQLNGLDISRATLSKIEAQIRCVTDKELRLIAKALKLKVDDLY